MKSTKGKSRHNNHKSELDYLRTEIRTLKSIIRNLRKELSQKKGLENRVDFLNEVLLESDIEPEITVEKCNQCHKGEKTTNKLGKWTLITCSQCNHRKVLK